MDLWAIAAIAVFGMGLASFLAQRFAPGEVDWGDWARALFVTAFAIYISGAAFRMGEGYVIWFSGFFVCAAIHRWIEAVMHGLKGTRG
jgi:hypothetical protein